MKKVVIIVLLLLSVLAAGGYFAYTLYGARNRAVSAWQFLPPGAVMVLETHQARASEQALREHPLLSGLRTLPAFGRFQAQLVQLDSLSSGAWRRGLEEQSMLVSMIMTSRQDFDFLLISPLKGIKAFDWLRSWQLSMEKHPLVKERKRNVRGNEVTEWQMPNGRFAFFVAEDVLVASFSPLLLEDALRQWESPRPVALAPVTSTKASGETPAFSSAPYTVHLNTIRFARLLQSFLPPDAERPLGEAWPYRLRLEPQAREEWLMLNGFANKPDSLPGFLSIFHNQQPQLMELAPLVPMRASKLYYLGFSKGKEWHQNLQAFWKQNELSNFARWEKLASSHPKQVNALLDSLGREVGVASIPRAGGVAEGRLAYIQLKSGSAVSILDALAERLHLAAGDTVYTESFREQRLGLISYPELPASLFGEAFLGFKESYYMRQNNYLVLANDVQLLKDLLLDQEIDYTWRSSLSMNRLLEKTQQEANVALYLNLPKLWPSLAPDLSSKWQGWYGNNQGILRAYDFLALQFSSLDRDFFANLLLHQSPELGQGEQRIPLASNLQYNFPAPLHTPAYLLNGPKGRLSQLLVQDTAGHVFALDAREKDRQQLDSLGEMIRTLIFQPDVKKNGRPNYLFATDHQLRLYNADWQLRPGFPQVLPEAQRSAFLQQIDYDGSKRYRFLLASESGDLFMYDAAGKLLEGWAPRAAGGALSMAPGHVRVRGKDVLYAFRKDGTLLLMNRRGEAYAGFPYRLKEEIRGAVAVRPGGSFQESRLITVSALGLLLELDFEGNTKRKQQLYRPEVGTRFSLIGDQRQENFLILRQDRYRIAVLNLQGHTLFEQELVANQPLEAQFFHLNGVNDLLVLRDPEQEFAYIFSLQGKLLHAQPLEASAALALQYQDKGNKYSLYVPYQQQLTRYSF